MHWHPLLEQLFGTLVVWSKYMGFFLLLEWLFAARRGQPISAKIFNLHYLIYYTLAYLVLVGWLNVHVVSGVENYAWSGVSSFQFFTVLDNLWPGAQLGAIAYTLCYLLIYDFFYYWYHRSQHRFALLWRVHRLHHADRHVNVTTSMRHHWLEEPLKVFVVMIPLALILKTPPPDLGVLSVIIGGWAFFIHANLRLHLGPLTRVFAGPQLHRVHHSIEPQHTDKNFAALFPIWDILFGTYFSPKRDEFPATGLHGNVDFPTVSAATLSAFIDPVPIAQLPESAATTTVR
jgi:sterol desaturase/sphingolipid hydroxylase (fatty acid hydroxylase superfamily)